jgi:hypothetical protein
MEEILTFKTFKDFNKQVAHGTTILHMVLSSFNSDAPHSLSYTTHTLKITLI